MSDQYVSGGKNPNWEHCCGSCFHMTKDAKYSSHGWCRMHENASVSITGGCDGHSEITKASREVEGVSK